MHLCDKKHLKAQKLLVTVYKDRYVQEGFPDEIFIKVESIQEAKYVSTHDMCKLHFGAEHIFKDIIDDLKDDVFYLVEIKTDGWHLKVKSYKEVTDKMIKKNPFLGLH